jgi:hypothetical protein
MMISVHRPPSPMKAQNLPRRMTAPIPAQEKNPAMIADHLIAIGRAIDP